MGDAVASAAARALVTAVMICAALLPGCDPWESAGMRGVLGHPPGQPGVDHRVDLSKDHLHQLDGALVQDVSSFAWLPKELH